MLIYGYDYILSCYCFHNRGNIYYIPNHNYYILHGILWSTHDNCYVKFYFYFPSYFVNVQLFITKKIVNKYIIYKIKISKGHNALYAHSIALSMQLFAIWVEDEEGNYLSGSRKLIWILYTWIGHGNASYSFLYSGNITRHFDASYPA